MEKANVGPDPGFKVGGLGFRGLGFMVQGSGFEVQSLGLSGV